jgi:hypothetical protein
MKTAEAKVHIALKNILHKSRGVGYANVDGLVHATSTGPVPVPVAIPVAIVTT